MAKPIITLNGLKIVIMLGMLVIILCGIRFAAEIIGNDSNLLIVFYVQIMPDDFVMQLHRF